MSPKELTAFRIDPDVMEGLRRVKDRDGVPISVQVDRALRTWLGEKGISVTPAKPSSRTGREALQRASRRARR
jgi:hypothetical protein